jgi:hypothetical protein
MVAYGRVAHAGQLQGPVLRVRVVPPSARGEPRPRCSQQHEQVLHQLVGARGGEAVRGQQLLDVLRVWSGVWGVWGEC